MAMADPPPRIGRDLSFFSTWFCPYAQRTWIALAEKNIPYNLEEVTLKDSRTGLWKSIDEKPKWLIKLNPLGKVPQYEVLKAQARPSPVRPVKINRSGSSPPSQPRQGPSRPEAPQVPILAFADDNGRVCSVYESLICNEFLEDFARPPEHPALFPSRPVDRARARNIIYRFDRTFVPNFYGILLKETSEERNRCTQELLKHLSWLETCADPAGPYFLGTQFSAVDCALLPWFIRMFVLGHFRSFQMPKDCRLLVSWYRKAMTKESVQATMRCPDEDEGYEKMLLQHYARYADGSSSLSLQ